MAVQVTIDAGSKNDAELIAAALRGQPTATSRRGYGIVYLRLAHEREAHDLLPVVADCVERHHLSWARIRFGEEERTFRSRRQPAS